MRKATDRLNELIEIARDGSKFYLDAAKKVKSPDLRAVFTTQANVREQLINDLSKHVVGRGDLPSEGETLVGKTRQFYADTLAKISNDKEQVYIDQLEETEDRLLEKFREALEHTESEDARKVLIDDLPTVQAAHDRMKNLKNAA
jgi:uncharacterized protein (TIGR02284 family)